MSLYCIYKRPYDHDVIARGPWRCPDCHEFEPVSIADIVEADTLWGHYSVRTHPLPCGHDVVCWYGWKQDFGVGPTLAYQGLSLQLSLESHVILRCAKCGAPQPLAPSNDRGVKSDIKHGARLAELLAEVEALT